MHQQKVNVSAAWICKPELLHADLYYVSRKDALARFHVASFYEDSICTGRPDTEGRRQFKYKFTFAIDREGEPPLVETCRVQGLDYPIFDPFDRLERLLTISHDHRGHTELVI